MNKPILLFSNTTNNRNLVGEPVKSYLWYGKKSHIYTVGIYTTKYYGDVHIEGTLISNPSDTDWFDVIPPKNFNLLNIKERNFGTTFTGIYLFLRARIVPSLTFPYSSGYIDRILLIQ